MKARDGFTLIELLVTIAIISLLLSILLPALSGARERANAVVCLSNIKQSCTALFQYALDYGVIPGTYWQGPVNLDWAGKNNAAYQANPGRYRHPLETSVLYPYLPGLDEIFECPGTYREANTFFDYTMIIRFAGAKTDLAWQLTYPIHPESPN